MKKFAIVKHGGGELANQLWNYASVYAYALEVGACVRNPSFFEYHKQFNLLLRESLLTRLVALFFTRTRRRAHPINRFWRTAYALYAKCISAVHKTCVLSSQNTTNTVVYLPPTKELTVPLCNTLYFEGWLFRNPEGLIKYRAELLRAFSPAPHIAKRVDTITAPLRAGGKVLLGVHIRQGDYKTFKSGKYLVGTERMRRIVDEYLAQQHLTPKEVALYIASDGPVDPAAFAGYTLHVSKEDAVTDLFALSKCRAIIGSDSSFGNFASWYGNAPHIVATNEPIDWPYYAGKSEYFENKYATLVQR